MPFSTRLSAIAKQRGLTVRQLAATAKVKPSFIHNWLAGVDPHHFHRQPFLLSHFFCAESCNAVKNLVGKFIDAAPSPNEVRTVACPIRFSEVLETKFTPQPIKTMANVPMSSAKNFLNHLTASPWSAANRV